jgi:DNA-binding transcriptional ArsR family regulator
MSKRSAERRGVPDAALVFAALGEPTRLALLRRLSRDGPASITVLAGDFRATRQGVTKHLLVLAAAGIIEGERRGREHVWAINRARIDEAQRQLALIASGWDDALTRLKAHVEQRPK